MITKKCGQMTGGMRGVCQEFLDAVHSGEMVMDAELDGWICSTFPLRKMSPSARWFGQENCGTSFKDHTGEPFVLEHCVFCGGDLPELASSYRRRMDCTNG